MRALLTLIGGCLLLATRAFSQDAKSDLTLIGNGRIAITPQVIATIRALFQTQAHADGLPIWMLHGDAYFSDANNKELRLITAYFSPQVFTDRLVRGDALSCLNTHLDRNWSFPDSPVVDGWSISQRQAFHYALVAPPERSFTTRTDFSERPFTVFGTPVANEDVVAIIDAVTRFAPRQRVQSMDAKNAYTVNVTGVGCGKGPDGYHEPNLTIFLQRASSGWFVTRSGRWMY